MNILNLVSLAGVVALMGVAWVGSENRRVVNWRVVVWGTVLQLAFAALVFRFPAGTQVFLRVNDAVVRVMDAAAAGARFVFGPLALPPGTTDAAGVKSLGFILAFQGFPTIIFFSALMSLLYFVGVMPLLVRAFARVFTALMRVSGAESLCTASNIFVGIESALTIKPHLAAMTRSELCTVLTAGMATVASNVMAVYVFSLKAEFPAIAGHLISASILSAPAALVMSKLLLPETETPQTLGRSVAPYYEKDSTLYEAVIRGANDGVRLIVGIVALLIAVLGLVALLDLVLTGLGTRLNGLAGIHVDWSLRGLLGWVFYPFVLLTGVPPSDAVAVARIVGERAIVTEVVAYQDLAAAIQNGGLSDPRSIVITTYALCGFAHLASMAIFVGGISALVPGQTRTLARLGLRALVAATLACLMTAAVAGAFYSGESVLMGRP